MQHPWIVEEVNCIARVCCCLRDLHALNQESISDQTLDAAAVSGHQVVFFKLFYLSDLIYLCSVQTIPRLPEDCRHPRVVWRHHYKFERCRDAEEPRVFALPLFHKLLFLQKGISDLNVPQ
ncbi:hypothetical protein AMECASPLE_024525 [Ameca splendens]|uniref:Uncharacterized protein n=1 Tax=Ameca splendens TaxID=208324 RepID=A0ABV0Z2D0_9TELE